MKYYICLILLCFAWGLFVAWSKMPSWAGVLVGALIGAAYTEQFGDRQ